MADLRSMNYMLNESMTDLEDTMQVKQVLPARCSL